MECRTKDELEQHLSDIRKLARNRGLASEEREAAVRAERFAIWSPEGTRRIRSRWQAMPFRHAHIALCGSHSHCTTRSRPAEMAPLMFNQFY